VERKKTKVGASFGCRTGSWLVFLSGDVEILGRKKLECVSRGVSTFKYWCQLTPATYENTEGDSICILVVTPSTSHTQDANVVHDPGDLVF
jgi:hypothetical protein